MNLHEYQGKALFREYGLPVSDGHAVDTADEAVAAAEKIGGDMWVVKAQVHAGGRGKAGGVKLIDNKEGIREFAEGWLGQRLVTYQTDANGQPVAKILVEACTDIDQELYLGAVLDRASQRIVFMASTEGGVEIEKVAEETPEKILRAEIDPLTGPMPYQGRDLAFRLGLQGEQIKQFVKIFVGLATLFKDKDLALIEVNPLVITDAGNLHCLDAKIGVDGNALCKVILETALLSDDEKRRASELAKTARAHFVKTSTGFSTGGANVSDVALMAEVVRGAGMEVKASGGISSYSDAKAMIEAGATRLGASASIGIVQEAKLTSVSA